MSYVKLFLFFIPKEGKSFQLFTTDRSPGPPPPSCFFVVVASEMIIIIRPEGKTLSLSPLPAKNNNNIFHDTQAKKKSQNCLAVT